MQILDDYIYNSIFDVWGMDPPERDQLLPNVYNKETFAQYVAVRQAENSMHF